MALLFKKKLNPIDKLIAYATTYNFKKEITDELIDMPEEKQKEFIKYFEIPGIDLFTAYLAIKGDEYSLQKINLKL